MNRQSQSMVCRNAFLNGRRLSGIGAVRRSAFTLIELLTVVFIISLLIGIFIPSLNAARNAAKKATTAKLLDTIEIALTSFKNDNESDFRRTNGFPPSFAHPRIPGYSFEPHLGEFPFWDDKSASDPPRVYGAHWLPAMLLGADFRGYVKRGNVPKTNDLRIKPWCWYPSPGGTACPPGSNEIERSDFYLDPGNTPTRRTDQLGGRENRLLNTRWDWDSGPDERDSKLPVIVDAFGQPVLYYVANKHGRATNMLERVHLETNDLYNRSAVQQDGVPYYFHQDNELFTGTSGDPLERDKLGWNFGGRPEGHAIGTPGDELTPEQLIDDANRETFARYIVDRKLFLGLGVTPDDNAPLRPVNADSYLLITAGPDGRFGTGDDVSNLPRWPD